MSSNLLCLIPSEKEFITLGLQGHAWRGNPNASVCRWEMGTG